MTAPGAKYAGAILANPKLHRHDAAETGQLRTIANFPPADSHLAVEGLNPYMPFNFLSANQRSELSGTMTKGHTWHTTRGDHPEHPAHRLTLMAHLPLLRIEPSSFSFDSMTIRGMTIRPIPFEAFDAFTGGAFEDHRAAYASTAPVFLTADFEIESEGVIHATRTRTDQSFDMKMLATEIDALPSSTLGILARFRNGDAASGLTISTQGRDALTSLGLWFLPWFHQEVVDHVRAALALAAPATLLPSPQLSVTFAHLDDDHAFVLGVERRAIGVVRLQGEADMEMLFQALCAGPPLDAEALQRMAALLPLVEQARMQPEISAAVAALLAAGAPTLSPADQSTLCSMALEALLLPEVQSGSARTFARRIASLLGSDTDHAQRLDAAGGLLYDARSAGIHGGAVAPRAQPAIDAAHAAQLLAAAIVEMTRRLPGAGSLEALRAELDNRHAPRATGSTALPLQEPVGLRARWRIGSVATRHPVLTTWSSHPLRTPEGTAACFAPLVGLACTGHLKIADGPAEVFPLGILKLLSLEHRDTRRDFIAQLMFTPTQVATLCIRVPDPGSTTMQDDRVLFRDLAECRDLGVLALRLASFETFIDPELLGMYVMRADRPLREPTVLRQSVLARLVQEPARTITPEDAALTASAWNLVMEYFLSDQHPELDRAMQLFRRAHDRDFLPPLARATLLLALIESLLGRFRTPDDPAPLELLVARVLGDPAHPAATWFAAEARDWRKSVAHGRGELLDDPVRCDHLLAVGRATLGLALRTWLDAKQPKARPARLLIRRLGGEEARRA